MIAWVPDLSHRRSGTQAKKIIAVFMTGVSVLEESFSGRKLSLQGGPRKQPRSQDLLAGGERGCPQEQCVRLDLSSNRRRLPRHSWHSGDQTRGPRDSRFGPLSTGDSSIAKKKAGAPSPEFLVISWGTARAQALTSGHEVALCGSSGWMHVRVFAAEGE